MGVLGITACRISKGVHRFTPPRLDTSDLQSPRKGSTKINIYKIQVVVQGWSTDMRSNLSVSTVAMAPTTRQRAVGLMQPSPCLARVVDTLGALRNGRLRHSLRRTQDRQNLRRPLVRAGAYGPALSSQSCQGPIQRHSRRHSASVPCAPPPAVGLRFDVLAG